MKRLSPSSNRHTESSADRSPTIYLTKRFPRLSETFILDEIIGLEHHGIDLRLYSIGDPGESLTQEKITEVRSKLTYLYPSGNALRSLWTALQFVRSNISMLHRHRARYLRTIFYIARKRRSSAAIKHFFEAGRLADLAERQNAAHIHAAFAHGPASVAHFAHLISGINFSFSAHAKDIYTSPPDLLAIKMAAASLVLTCSESAKSELERIASSHPRAEIRDLALQGIVLEPHGVDTDLFSPDGDHESLPVRILAVGRLVPKKGYPTLLDALAKLKVRGVGFDCKIIGSGEMKTYLMEKSKLSAIDGCVEFAGASTQAEIAEQYRLADIFVQASEVTADGDRDGIPNSLMEAMASGLAVIATPVGGIPEIVHNEISGMIFPQRDPTDLANVLERLIEDRDLRRKLGENARVQMVEEMSREVCIARVAEHLRTQNILATKSQSMTNDHLAKTDGIPLQDTGVV